ncbi:MAG: molecular chaperone TorD family protein [Nitrospirae bacterium]|nr:molecular chaperone TorD family protein [Nitrospirota bacterium]MBF0533818.1 molecular chaperone TorD family protein [Nitrospirota bacterium]MBF0615473.1 molecular chaperone TorD family protein [Nitrospirota bacterium]
MMTNLAIEAVEYEQATAVVRSRIYGLLAAGFRQMTEEHFQELSHHYVHSWKDVVGFLAAGEGHFLPLVDSISEALKTSTFDTLYEEYNSLFLSFGRTFVTPYEMECMRDTPQHSLTSQAELADVAGFYNAFGLNTATDVPERVDHISTELEFMHVMALKEATALENANTEHIEIVQHGQQKFMSDHLGRWAKRFTEAVIAIGDTGSFYHVLAKMLSIWVDIDNSLLFDEK